MNPRSENSRHFGSTAATLLVAYLLILQGIAAGAVASTRGAALFADAICLSKSSGALDGAPGAPIRSSRHGDACCVVQMAGFGGAAAPSPFIGETPPALTYVEARLAFGHALPSAEAATPPLGSRAPPVLI
ncbi:DUF2946 family protein [Methylocystis parvus]|uniref:DUF2946 domain-containing protein n=1 Tax=Methylocystis parvus TaxID=134 RepID=A0A6B8M4T9_9HYPH|nr:DUF2946 family protein [Methylocystis parvus]QGM97355.1 hypothetical protein F7D14_07630 [Methylocystis parvus]WBJ98733.1 hypothetical protein MMG94_11985 [Methylocystis parvus OBBP]